MIENLRLRNEPVVVWFDREVGLPDSDDGYHDEENIHTQARKYRPKRRTHPYYKYATGMLIVVAMIVLVYVVVLPSGSSKNAALPEEGSGSLTTAPPPTPAPTPTSQPAPEGEPEPPQNAVLPGLLVTNQAEHNTDLQRTEYTAVLYYHQDHGSAEVKAHDWLKSWDEWARHVQSLPLWKDAVTVAIMGCSSEEDLHLTGSNFCTTTMGHRHWRIQPEIGWYWKHHLIAKQATSTIPSHRPRLEFWDEYLTKLIQSDKSGHN